MVKYMATLNLDYYDGNDYYSDGEIENIILDIVKEQKKIGDYSDINDFFPVLYHLSPERENILNWYPFKESDTVLEIGAGCGAITGLLCRLAKHVTSIELSKKRSEINYERNHAYDNLDIIVGNIDSIVLNAKFDYIVLNGVFEYAMSFTKQNNPYVFFINNVKKYLNDSGKILLAIENRLGVKYFSGAAEDHTNTYYTGLNGYKENNTVRTFSRSELEDIFTQCGFSNWKFYYPYPDYKFPTEIFTDSNVNDKNYGKNYRNYQSNRVGILNELEMINTFKKEKVMGQFSNSFLVEICLPDSSVSNVIYAKLNNTRKKEFCISTVAYNNQGEYYVQKAMLDKSAERHIENIYHNQQKNLPEKFEYLQGEYLNGVVRYPYIQYKSLDQIMTDLLSHGKITELEKEIDCIYYAFIHDAREIDDFYSDEFIQCFGKEKLDCAVECINDCNVDLIFNNVYKTNDKYIIIDPEWVFGFAIPVKFVIWRMLNEWYSKYGYIDDILPRKELYDRYEITEQMCSVFEKWAIYFATRFVSDIDMDAYAQKEKVLDINALIQSYCDKDIIYSSLYVDYGNGYSENEKSSIRMVMEGNKFHIKTGLDKARFIHSIRWDPIENKCCRCIVRECKVDTQKVDIVPINSETNDDALFLTFDPQVQIQIQPGIYEFIEIEGEIEVLDENAIFSLMKEKNCELEAWIEEKGELNNTVNELENAKLDLEAKVQTLCNTINELENFKTNSETKIQNLEEKCENLNAENTELVNENSILYSVNRRMNTESKIILAENDVLHSENRELNKQDATISTENAKMENEIKQLHDIVEDLKKNKGLQEAEIIKLCNRINTIENDKVWKLFNKLRMSKGYRE